MSGWNKSDFSSTRRQGYADQCPDYYEKSLTGNATTSKIVWNLNITLGSWVQQHCYTRVNSTASTILAESWLFEIATQNTSGATYWPSNSSAGVHVAETPLNGSEAVTPARPAPSALAVQPATSDQLCSLVHIQSNGTPLASCFDGSTYNAACWEQLQMGQWIPAWIGQRQPCGLNNTCGNGSQNSWTHAFLREVDGSFGTRDCSALSDTRDCFPQIFSPRCPAADALSDARHRYVAFAIVCEFTPCSGVVRILMHDS